MAIALEPNTPRLLHASIAVFYSTIHAVANASKLSDRVGDLQAFLDDLVKVAARMGGASLLPCFVDGPSGTRGS